MRSDVVLTPREEAGKTLAMVGYALYGLGVFTMLPAVVALILNIVKRDDVRGTFIDSHFRWQISTALWGAFWLLLGWILTFVFIGIVVVVIASLWILYRLIKGFLRLNDHQPVS